MRIWIDAGHGGTASGAVNGSRKEKDDALRFALELERQLQAQGCETVMTRRTDSDVTPEARTKLEREKKCDLAISCHRNAATASARGVEAWLHSTALASIVEWAESTVCAVAKASGMPLRPGSAAPGVYKGYRDNPKADYFVNRDTRSPSMLLELGFISNSADNAAFDAKLPDMCAAVAREACAYLGLAYGEAGEEESPVDYKALYEEAKADGTKWQARAEAAEDALERIRELVTAMAG